MTITVLFSNRPEKWETYEKPLRDAFLALDLDVHLSRDASPETVDYVVYAPSGGLQDFTPFTQLKAVLSLWAGVEKIETNTSIKAPLCRMVDDGLSQGMVEWVTGHILRHHLAIDQHILHQDGVWRNQDVPPLASEKTIGFLGLGVLGLACAQAARWLNFQVQGWSRNKKDISGLTTFSGEGGLHKMLSTTDILVLLLPDTTDTRDIMDAKTIAMLPPDAIIINPGRGTLIDDNALINALDNGQIAHATLDVFREEPLSKNHPYWAHENVTVTPHIASETRPTSASRVIAQNIQRGEAGLPLLHMVDREQGY